MIDLSQEFACNSHLQTLGATEALFYFFFRLLENVSAELWEASAWPLPSKSELTECPTSQRRHETSMNCGCPDTTLSSANSFFVSLLLFVYLLNEPYRALESLRELYRAL